MKLHRTKLLTVAFVSASLLFGSSQSLAIDPIKKLTGRSLKNHVERAAKRTEKSFKKFLHNPVEYALEMPLTMIQEVCAIPANSMRYNYLAQADGKWQSLPQWLIDGAQRHYSVDLRKVRFAENVHVLNARAITMGNLIYFKRSIDLNIDRDLWLMLHELEHTIHYKKEKRSAKLCEYTVKAYTHGFNHDNIDWEKAADAKADSVMAAFYEVWRAEEDDQLRPHEFYIENLLPHNVHFQVIGRSGDKDFTLRPGEFFMIGGNDTSERRYRVFLDFVDGSADYYDIQAGRFYQLERHNRWGIALSEF